MGFSTCGNSRGKKSAYLSVSFDSVNGYKCEEHSRLLGLDDTMTASTGDLNPVDGGLTGHTEK